MKRCSKCHLDKESTEFHKDDSKLDGLQYLCKTCRNESGRAYYVRPEIGKKRQSIKYRYRQHKKDAKRRKIPFELTLEQFMSFWQKSCIYCGSKIETIGLDRIDTSKGYVLGNIAPCCSTCNRMKLDHSVLEFLAQCRKITEYQTCSSN